MNQTHRRLALLSVLAASVMATGCASIVNDTTQPMRVDALSGGLPVAGVPCVATNDYGTSQFKTGDTFQARRSSKDLDITCTGPQGTAKGRAISRANAGLAGNILLGGGIGAIVDHNRGTAYTYPTWVRLIFGDDLVFDRNSEKDGFPVQGMRPGAAPVATN